MCIQHAYEKYEADTLDVALVHSAAKDLGLDASLIREEHRQHIEQIMAFSVRKESARSLAGKIRKLAIARAINDQLHAAQSEIMEVTGNESASHILGIAESKILDLGASLSGEENQVRCFGTEVLDYIEERANNPLQQLGLSTGFPIWDNAIGGGLRGGTLNVIGARAKGFKSGIALNMGKHVAKMGIPVLYLDTELSFKEQMPRLIASETGFRIHDIETGRFDRTMLRSAAQTIHKMPFNHREIVGAEVEDQFAMMRQWIHRVPGVSLSGKANPCLLIYDYLKLMDASRLQDLREHQVIGFLVTQLHNFSKKYDIPILTFVQLNRDGINQEDTGVISQSDRILWFCSNFTIFKPKSDEEMAEDPSGNYKLVPKSIRHGPGLVGRNYINVNVNGGCFQISEGKLKTEVVQEKLSGGDDESIDF